MFGNKNDMSIVVSVLTASSVARNIGGTSQQENHPYSSTEYSSERHPNGQCN